MQDMMLCCTPSYQTPFQRFIEFYPTLFSYLCALIFLAMVSTLAIKGSKRLLVVKTLSLLVMAFLALAAHDVPFFKDTVTFAGTTISALFTAAMDNVSFDSTFVNVVFFMFVVALFVAPILLLPFMPLLVTLANKPQGRYQATYVQAVQYLTGTFTALTTIYFLLILR
ncbi:hypothetical protein JL857_20690 [Vibrio parahaemolyticus]|nr:hypothetical protein [Vibrio parahaemolyticus]MCI9696477.1 hypothetical protein [Vibrio parahaemolyticus]MCI9711059.1 hypothetical protein [Vibrio parahaemolyticus]MCI9715939.1 hypothetical protein [Vibrio parahaemolyticus]